MGRPTRQSSQYSLHLEITRQKITDLQIVTLKLHFISRERHLGFPSVHPILIESIP